MSQMNRGGGQLKNNERPTTKRTDSVNRVNRRVGILRPLVALILLLMLIAGVIVYYVQNRYYRRTQLLVTELEVEYQELLEKNEKLNNQLAMVRTDSDPSGAETTHMTNEDAPGVSITLGLEDSGLVDEEIRAMYIEEIARDQLGMVRPGEVLFEEANRR